MNKFLVTAATALVLSATTASATCMSNCGTEPTPTSPTTSIFANGKALVNGDLTSQFMGSTGENIVTKEGDTMVDVRTTLNGFCPNGDCTQTELEATLRAFETGSVTTMAMGDQSDALTAIEDTGVLQAGTQLMLGFNDDATTVQGEGLAAFNNYAAALGVGDHVNTTISSYGTGATESMLATDGILCPDCKAFEGGVTSAAKAGTSQLTEALGGTSGEMVRISNQALTQTQSQASTLFED